MNLHPSVKRQTKAARTLLELVSAGRTERPLDPCEARIGDVQLAFRRILYEALAGLDDVQAAQLTSNTVGYLGEFIGRSLQNMPPPVAVAAMSMFAEEMNAVTAPNGSAHGLDMEKVH